jgi:hypothetical protein
MNSPVGTEVVDPPWFDELTNSGCPAGMQCRYSDAALIRYDDGITWSHGQFPSPVSSTAPFNFTTLKRIDQDASPPYSDMAHAYIGKPVVMMGRTSGEKTGVIKTFCARVRMYEGFNPQNFYLLCQFQTTLDPKGGDSGAPAYMKASDGHMSALMGLMVGAGFKDITNEWYGYFSHHYYASREVATQMGGGRFDIRIGQCNHSLVCPRY